MRVMRLVRIYRDEIRVEHGLGWVVMIREDDSRSNPFDADLLFAFCRRKRSFPHADKMSSSPLLSSWPGLFHFLEEEDGDQCCE